MLWFDKKKLLAIFLSAAGAEMGWEMTAMKTTKTNIKNKNNAKRWKRIAAEIEKNVLKTIRNNPKTTSNK